VGAMDPPSFNLIPPLASVVVVGVFFFFFFKKLKKKQMHCLLLVNSPNDKNFPYLLKSTMLYVYVLLIT
jgi:hypothetical protein